MEFTQVATPAFLPQPPVYFCPRARGPLTVDGDLDKPFWADVPFTADFRDISGPGFPAPRFRTRAKLCWDDTRLYVGALLEGGEHWATLRKRDSVIYRDNDFELFLDPSSSTHHYMEFELNARNTRWDLLLTRPYRDGGRSVSCWDCKGVRSAVRVDGPLNDPFRTGRFWSVELAIPFAPLLESYTRESNPPERERCLPVRTAPRRGEFWRLNFSRVQWRLDVQGGRYRKRTGPEGRPLPEDNWVWAPTGLIDIHCPEFWGFLFFTERGETCPVPEDERRKLALRRLYYAEHAALAARGAFTSDLSALGGWNEPYPAAAEVMSRGFLLTCPAADGQRTVLLRSDGFTAVV